MDQSLMNCPHFRIANLNSVSPSVCLERPWEYLSPKFIINSNLSLTHGIPHPQTEKNKAKILQTIVSHHANQTLNVKP